MNYIRITKEFTFEAAHALKGYNGPCKNIHGHSYELSVTIKGRPNPDPVSEKNGMVLDFGELKNLIKKQIIDPFDHALLLNSEVDQKALLNFGEPFTNIIFLPYQPTSENFLLDFARRIRPLLPPGIQLYSMRLRETSSSFAEWFAEDN
ncbi:MAG: 6-carboxytetrahydropterin synthase [Bacteroidales bacterium]|nr:6-carboxytetrahydropterin synthase [Bacteroidales bacterium]MDD4602316.1 6-carboxytetrahydropterin synthase [Bacteroidales bacterium]